MTSREQYFEDTLPLLGLLVPFLFEMMEDSAPLLNLVGPTKQEWAQHGVDTDSFRKDFDDNSAWITPVLDGTDVASILEPLNRLKERTATWPLTILAVPPDTQLKGVPPYSIIPPSGVDLSLVSPNVLLSDRMKGYLNRTFFVYDHDGPHRDADNTIWYQLAGQTKAPASTIPNTAAYDKSTIERMWSQPGAYQPVAIISLAPTAVQLRRDYAKRSLVLVQQSGWNNNQVYLRRFRWDINDAPCAISSQLQTMVRVFAGNGSRGDDDYIVPAWWWMRDMPWLMESGARPLRSLHTDIAITKGLRIQRVRDVCSVIDEVTPPVSIAASNDVLYFALSGPQFGTASVTPPPAPDGSRFVRLRTKDVRLLQAELSEANTQTCDSFWRSVAMGSWNHPTLSIDTLLDTEIAWPTATQRLEIINTAARARNFASEVHDAAADMADRLGDIDLLLSPENVTQPGTGGDAAATTNAANFVAGTEHNRVSGNAGSVWPFAIPAGRVYGIADISLPDCISEGLYQLPTIPDAAGSRSTTYQALSCPAAIAHLKRRLDNEPDQSRWSVLQFDLGEVYIKHHVCVLLSLASSNDRAQCCDIWQRVMANKYGVGLMLGQWKALQLALLKVVIKDGTSQTLFGSIYKEFKKDNASKLDKITTTFCERRNEWKGHGYTPASAIQISQSRELTTILEQIENITRWLWKTTYFLEAVVKTRKSNRIVRQVLGGDNPNFERQSFETSVTDPRLDLPTREIYIEVNSQGTSIGLHPWVHFAPDEITGHDTLWYFDGVDRQVPTVIYKSPFAPTKSLSVPENYDDVRDVTGQ